VRLTINQGADRLILQDDGMGNFAQVAGTAATLSTGTVDYITGAFSVTFTASLLAGGVVQASYDNVRSDYRQNQKMVVNSLEDGDWWPHPEAVQTAPVDTTTRKYDGKPLTTPTVADTDPIEYEGLKDIVVQAAATDLRFYDDTYLYDNSFHYDSVLKANGDVYAINLRKLNFRLVAKA